MSMFRVLGIYNFAMIIKHEIAFVRNQISFLFQSYLHLRICKIQDVDQMMLLDYNISSVKETDYYVKCQ